MKSNIADIVCEYLEATLQLPFIISIDLITDTENDGACIRYDPAPAYEKRFIDNTRLVSWNLTFYVRCKDSIDSREYAKQIIDTLDGVCIGSDTTSIDCEAVTLPQFIDVDEKGFTTYSSAIKCEYLEILD